VTVKTTSDLRFGAVLLALVVVVATGCIRLDLAVTVDADGTGTLEMDAAISDSLAEFAEAFSGDESAGTCEELLEDSDLPSGASSIWSSAHPYSEDGWCGVRLTGQFTDFDLSALEEDGEMPFRLWSEDELVYFEMDISDLSPGDDEEMSFDELMTIAKVLDLEIAEPEITIEATLPGAPLDHNADSTSGSTFRWDVNLAGGESRTSLSASADMSAATPADGGPWVLIIVIGAALVLLLVVSFAVMRRRRAGTASAGEPPPDPTLESLSDSSGPSSPPSVSSTPGRPSRPAIHMRPTDDEAPSG